MASSPAKSKDAGVALSARPAAQDARPSNPSPGDLSKIRAALGEVQERYAGLRHQPLHVSATLLRPPALNDPVLFDGLLRMAVVKEYAPCQALAGMPVPEGLSVPLPLAASSGKRVYPLCSVGHADPGAEVVLRPGHRRLLEYAVTWHKTWEHSGDDTLVFQSDSGKPLRGKISLGGAQYKGWSMRQPVIDWREVHFWCRGDLDEIAKLLAHVPAVGKRASWGFGLVRDWRVERCPHDWSERGPDGRPTRPLPVEDWPEPPPLSVLAHGAYRSPAYDARDWCDVWVAQ